MKALWILALLLGTGFAHSAAAQEDVDLSIVNRIKQEAFNHSQVMNYMHYLADVNGARLATSPDYRRAARWAVGELKKQGITDARLEEFDGFGRSWAWTAISVQMLEPQSTTLNGVPLAWSSGTKGPVASSVIYAPLWEDSDDPGRYDLVKLAERIESYKHQYTGQLGGKIVLLAGKRKFDIPSEPEIQRWSDDDLADMESARDPSLTDLRKRPQLQQPVDADERLVLSEIVPEEIQADYALREMDLMDRLIEFLNAEQVSAVMMTNMEGTGGIIFAEQFGSFRSDAPVPPPAVQLMPEHYNRLVRLIERDVPVTLRIKIDATFPEKEAAGTNVVAELPGNSKRREIVMMGAHLDSWHTGTGATDNAAGCAVVMEAMRILKALDLDLDRTVRMGLWDGEEQGHYGSRAYVRKHLGDPVTMQLKPEHAVFSSYFNIDTGSGRTRGILTQANDMVRPIFESLMQPFKENGIATIVPRNDWGTDHMAFDSVGLPAFDLLQDQLDYWSHTHHSNVDTVDHVLPQDMMISAAFLASLVYQAAARDELMPRVALPQPLPEPGPLPDILQN
ncbi:MAG TPA: M20/M25/M40 family metallo-hydrolase [Woeseiaceae bacterium]|nr:M20/M25/M40 family metallo-hydrolase [Woeseiaceae bacterium]